MPPSPSFSRISKCETVRPTMSMPPRECVGCVKCYRDSLRVDDNLRIVQLRLAGRGALVMIRFAARIAGFVADRFYGASPATAGAKLFSLGARAVAGEFYVPGFIGARITGPGNFVALLGVM